MKLETKLLIAAGAGLALFWLARRAGAAVADTFATSLNPASDQNLAYRSVNAIGETVSGEADWTLGGAIYDATHKDDIEHATEIDWCALSPVCWLARKLGGG